jgi:hypothetical protein
MARRLNKLILLGLFAAVVVYAVFFQKDLSDSILQSIR